MNAEIVDYPVSDLPDRYDKARSAIYTQMDKLGISPTRRGNRSFITHDQISLLDALNGFLDEDPGHDIDDFIRELKSRSNPGRKPKSSTQRALALPPSTLSSSLSSSLSVVQDGEDIVLDNRIGSLRERFELLDNCASKGWLLSTSDLATITGLSSRTLTDRQEFARWGFTFTKRPERTGQEVSWSVKAPKRKER